MGLKEAAWFGRDRPRRHPPVSPKTLWLMRFREDSNKQLTEPIEEVMCEISVDVSGAIIEALSLRKGELRDMTTLQVGDRGEGGRWRSPPCGRGHGR